MPIGMAYVAELFEPHERGKALGVWGTGIMLGPALGPTLGGYLTDYFSWRAIFSVNVPFGILTFAAGFLLMKSDWKTIRKRIPFDFWGYVFLSLAVITGLLALSQGQEKGWDSTYIYTCMACVVIGITMFISIETASRNPLLDLSLFRSTNYSVSMVLAVFRAVGLFGGIFLLPIFLENLVGYTTIQTGLWMMPGAVALAICMPLSGKLADRYSPRWLVLFGTAITGMSMLMYGYLDPLSGAGMIIGPQIIRGAGLAFMMAPLLTAAINSIPKAQTAVASGFLNIAQQIGGSFGIAILNTYVTSSIQTHAVRIGEMIGTSTPEFSRLVHYSAYSALRQPHGQMFSGQSNTLLVSPFSSIMNHASVMGFNNGFVLGGLIVLAGIPLCLLLKPSEHHNKRHLRT
jgi:DHA2 family multidrug resistance protein